MTHATARIPEGARAAGWRRGPLAGCAGIAVAPGRRSSSSAAATAARRWPSTSTCGATARVDVTLVEADAAFVSCPMSNLVLGGSKQIADITVSYDGLAKRGVKRRRDTAQAVDPTRQTVRIATGSDLPYDRLVLSPGVDFLFDQVPGLDNAEAQDEDPARVESGTADGGVAQAARGDARRRRVRDLDSARALSLSARARTSARARSRGTSSARSRAARC